MTGSGIIIWGLSCERWSHKLLGMDLWTCGTWMSSECYATKILTVLPLCLKPLMRVVSRQPKDKSQLKLIKYKSDFSVIILSMCKYKAKLTPLLGSAGLLIKYWRKATLIITKLSPKSCQVFRLAMVAKWRCGSHLPSRCCNLNTKEKIVCRNTLRFLIVWVVLFIWIWYGYVKYIQVWLSCSLTVSVSLLSLQGWPETILIKKNSTVQCNTIKQHI